MSDTNKRRKRTTSRKLSESGEELCPVCSEVLSIYAIGKCDHAVCYRCATRMRVLCDQLYCPICRTDLPQVILMKVERIYSEVKTGNYIQFRKYGILYENQIIQSETERLLEHPCIRCKDLEPFRNFNSLKDHVRREHSLFFCDICLRHLKLFTSERRVYTRQLLGVHRRIGDKEDKSHKGHPLCEFCDLRFLDKDELAKHLRKQHYICHFCEADGITNQFYSDYSFLAEHFRDAHFLCDEGECAKAEFTNAFRSEIDLKAHASSEHSRNMRKSQQRQMRTLDIDFNLAPRGRGGGVRERDRGGGARDRGSGGRRNAERNKGVVTAADYEDINQTMNKSRNQIQRQQKDEYDAAKAAAISAAEAYNTELEQINSTPDDRTLETNYNVEVEDFPSLDGKVKSTTGLSKSGAHQPAPLSYRKMAEEDFPSLNPSSSTAAPLGKSSNTKQIEWKPPNSPAQSRTLAKTVAYASQQTVSEGNDVAAGDFPSLGGISAPVNPATWNIKSSKPQKHSKARPKASGLKVLSSHSNKLGANQQNESYPSLSSISDALLFDPSSTEINSGKSNDEGNAISVTPRQTNNPSDNKSKTGKKKDAKKGKTKETKESELTQHNNSSLKCDIGSKKKNEDTNKLKELFKDNNVTKLDKESNTSGIMNEPASTVKAQNQSAKSKNSDVSKKLTTVTKGATQVKSTHDIPNDWNEDFPSLGNSCKTLPRNEGDTGGANLDLLAGSSKFDILGDQADGDFTSKNAIHIKPAHKTKKQSRPSKHKLVDDNEFPSLGNPANAFKLKGSWSMANDDMDDGKTERKGKPLSDPDFVIPTDGSEESSKKTMVKLSKKQLKKTNREENVSSKNDTKHKQTKHVITDEAIQPLKEHSFNHPDVPSLDDIGSMLIETGNFPVLNSHIPVSIPAVIPGTKPPPGLIPAAGAPPPGFAAALSMTKSPPPGFSTINNISGTESKSARDQASKSGSYSQPQNFKDRNFKLLEAVQSYTKDSNDNFNGFKSASSQFRKGSIPASAYYDKCVESLGEKNFQEILPELIALLPDISKQQELLDAYKKGTKAKKGQSKKLAWIESYDENLFHTCSTCGQVLVPSDFECHLNEHSADTDFPVLGSASRPKYGLSAWVKA